MVLLIILTITANVHMLKSPSNIVLSTIMLDDGVEGGIVNDDNIVEGGIVNGDNIVEGGIVNDDNIVEGDIVERINSVGSIVGIDNNST